MSQKKTTQPSLLLQQLTANAGIQNTSNDNSWDYIESLGNDVRAHIINITGVVLEAQKILEGFGGYVGEACVLVEGIFGDINKASLEWRANRERHIGKKGFGQTANETAMITDIGTTYIQTHEQLIVSTSFSAPRLQELVSQVELQYRQLADESLQPAETLIVPQPNTNI